MKSISDAWTEKLGRAHMRRSTLISRIQRHNEALQWCFAEVAGLDQEITELKDKIKKLDDWKRKAVA